VTSTGRRRLLASGRRTSTLRPSSFASTHGAPAKEVHNGQEDDRTEQGDEERWQAQMVLVDGANAEQGGQQDPRDHGANNPDHDIEDDPLLGVRVHNDTRDPSEDTPDDQPEDKIHFSIPFSALKRCCWLVMLSPRLGLGHV